jgi:tetratricopeptide (TPR) repeat protein
MKYIYSILLSLFFFSSFAQQISYDEFKQRAKTEINLMPEYGNAVKSQGQIDEDNKFIATVLKQDTTRKKGSDHLVQLGFNYLYRGDLLTAMRRFNQAWLLNPKNEDAYWGFGSVYFYFNDVNEALKQLDRGLLINPQSSNILTDKATIYIQFYMDKHDAGYLDKAIETFIRSYKIDHTNQNTLFKLSAAYYYKNDCVNAWKYYDECMKLGGQPITAEYTDALKKQCKR